MLGNKLDFFISFLLLLEFHTKISVFVFCFLIFLSFFFSPQNVEIGDGAHYFVLRQAKTILGMCV